MGILNITSDSFSDAGIFLDKQKAVERLFQMEEEGADVIDIGAESTRPGSQPVPEEEELKRLIPVLKAAAGKIKIPISIDTYKANVAARALDEGASVINDVTAGRDPRILQLAAESGAGLVLMHMKGTPSTMQDSLYYEDVIGEVSEFLSQRIRQAQDSGVLPEQIVVDPGIGFGKDLNHNLIILNRLGELSTKLSRPVLVGPSRKSFIGRITGLPASERLEGTIAAVVSAYRAGAHIFRVHDVKEVKRALMVAEAIRNENSGN